MAITNNVREHFTTSRELEYFTESELNKQIGVSKDKWAITLVKELIDNALDACESIGVEPYIKVVIDDNSISVQDNGSGIPEKVITDSLNYGVRVSDKQAYVSPTRGQQGNALKCLYAVPYVASGEQAQIEIQAHSTRYFYTLSANKITQSIDVNSDIQKGDFVEIGSFFKIHNFNLACLNSQFSQKDRNSTKQDYINLICKFSLCNCHAHFELIFDGELFDYPATAPQQKWTLKDALVSHWYSQEQFANLIARNIALKPDMSVNEFVKQFNGLKTSAKQKEAADTAGINSKDGLKQFVKDADIDKDAANKLLQAMNQLSVPVKAEKLGLLNKDHLKLMLNGDDSKVYEHRYSKSKPDYNGLPYTIDVVFQSLDDDSEERYSSYILCINHSVLIDGRAYFQNIYSHYSIAEDTYIERGNPVRLFIHITCPYLDFTGKGKNEVNLNRAMFLDVKDKIALASKAWTKIQKSKKREQRASWKQEERDQKEYEKEIKSQFLSIKDAHAQVIEEAYRETAGSVNIAKYRQVFYQARPLMLPLIKETSIDYGYFRDLTKLFLQENPELTASWDIIADARGNFFEPHSKVSVPLGTVEVRNYISSLHDRIGCSFLNNLSFDVHADRPVFYYGHKGNFKNVLFIEKEGFEQIIKASKIQERYDIAILASKGMSVDAARDLIQKLYGEGIKIFALHDFDIAGLNIARTLKEDTALYKFKSEIEVIDIGLRGEDIEGLEREPVYYDKKLKDPRQMAIKAGATEEEATILVQKKDTYKEQWRGERVELNAMTSDRFIEFIETKLNQHGVKKVVPENEVLEQFYKATHKSNMLNSVVNALYKSISPYIRKIENEITNIQKDVEITPPENLQEIVRDKIEGSTLHWTDGIREVSNSKDEDAVTKKKIDKMIKPILEEIKEKFAA